MNNNIPQTNPGDMNSSVQSESQENNKNLHTANSGTDHTKKTPPKIDLSILQRKLDRICNKVYGTDFDDFDYENEEYKNFKLLYGDKTPEELWNKLLKDINSLRIV